MSQCFFHYSSFSGVGIFVNVTSLGSRKIESLLEQQVFCEGKWEREKRLKDWDSTFTLWRFISFNKSWFIRDEGFHLTAREVQQSVKLKTLRYLGCSTGWKMSFVERLLDPPCNFRSTGGPPTPAQMLSCGTLGRTAYVVGRAGGILPLSGGERRRGRGGLW